MKDWTEGAPFAVIAKALELLSKNLLDWHVSNFVLVTAVNGVVDGVKLDKQKVSEWLLGNKINVNQRAETLTIQDWINLAESL